MRIAIIGTRGLPPRYGGFETLASELSHELSRRSHDVIVYGRSGFSQPKHVEIEPGVIAHRLPTIRIEALESLSAGFFGALHSLLIFKPDVVLLCNPGNVWVGKLLEKRGIPVILHMAGLEFKREKWRGLASKVLWWAVQSAVKSNLQLLTDSNAIATWYQDTFSREIDVIEYGAKPVEPKPEVLNQFGLVKNEYDVVIARFEPDTQIVTIINAHARASTNKLVLIGEARDSATMSAYTEEIERAVQSHPNILVLGSIWDELTVDSLWSFSRTYIHGHRTGGTNPALVRAAASGTEVLAFQSPFNIEVLGDNGWYWDSPQDLEELLRKQPWVTSAKSEELRLSTLRRYQWSSIADAYEELMKSVCSGQSRQMHYFESIQGMKLQYRSGLRPALSDLRAGYRNKDAWWLISRHQVQTKYRRTILGSWWITIQRLVFVAGLTYIFGSLMGKELDEFVTHVATGFIIFGTITTTLTSGASLLTSNSVLLKNSAMPLSIVYYRNFASNLIQLAHDALALAVVLVIFHNSWSVNTLFSALGLLLILINMFFITLWMAPLAARFRDIGPIVNALASILMFITPIFWQIEDLNAGERDVLTVWNPFTYLLETVRAPLLGRDLPPDFWWIATGFTFANLILGLIIFAGTRNRIRYWV